MSTPTESGIILHLTEPDICQAPCLERTRPFGYNDRAIKVMISEYLLW